MSIDRYKISMPSSPLSIAVTRARPATQRFAAPVLYVHGATFPSELAVGYKFDGLCWRCDLVRHGYEVWAFDFLGFGASDRCPEMTGDASAASPLGRASSAVRQLAAVIAFIQAKTGAPRVSLVAHSWGSIVAGLCAASYPFAIERLVFFGPVVQRQLTVSWPAAAMPAWMTMTREAQWQRFSQDVPSGHTPVLAQSHFDRWASDYLATDSACAAHGGVRIPMGPMADIAAGWHGALAYDPALITAPLRIVRGEWDSLCNDADAAWLLSRLPADLDKDDVKLPEGTHLMHLERGRDRLYAATRAWLSKGDRHVPVQRHRRDLRGEAA